MCGIVGLVAGPNSAVSPTLDLASRMISKLEHRGPDGKGVWVDSSIALGHARLAIRDLSPNGAQPMISASGRYVIVYNGEVYSQKLLIDDLRKIGLILKGNSDTEAILEHVSAFGLDETIPKLIGMFAFALWDRKIDTLTLVRDRLGIKPIYWAIHEGNLVFSSELKAFTQLPNWNPILDRDAIAEFLRHSYIPTPHTAFKGVHKLNSGHILKYSTDGVISDIEYWNAKSIAREGIAQRANKASQVKLDEIEALLTDAVSKRMISDVPIGSLLSGGIDSSLVTALMVENSIEKIHSFSIGNQDSKYDEAPFARAIAAHLGTLHTELYVEPQHALGLVSALPRIYDEPFADSSQLPSILISELTKKHVTVVLTGDGGDELFAGYNRYSLGLDIIAKLHVVPNVVRNFIAHMIMVSPEIVIEKLTKMLPVKYRRTNASAKLKELAYMFSAHDPNAFYRGLITHWTNPSSLVLGSAEPTGPIWDASIANEIPDELDRMQLLDILTYLPDDILVKMDRASMSVGLEARVPLLDHRLVELSWRLPQDMKIRNGVSKWALREILARRLPRELFERPKMGFGIPIDVWLRTSLREWAEDLLSHNRLKEQGLLDPFPVRKRWEAHLRGEDWAYPLWDVLMLQAWIDEWKPSLG